MTDLVVDERFFPVVVNVLPTAFTKEAVDTLIDATDRILAREVPYVTVTDVCGLQSMPGAKFRRMLAQWNQRIAPLTQRYCIGSVLIVDNPIQRGAITALFWLAPPPYPHKVVATHAPAVGEAQAFYEGSGRKADAAFAAYAREYAGAARSAS